MVCLNLYLLEFVNFQSDGYYSRVRFQKRRWGRRGVRSVKKGRIKGQLIDTVVEFWSNVRMRKNRVVEQNRCYHSPRNARFTGFSAISTL